MKASCFSCLMAVAAMLAGCAQTDRVTFVTASEVGIGADATLGNVNIGYDRNELVIGPVYPATGALPPVYAKLDSDLAIFNPRIQQIYATGEAARLVTDPARPAREEAPLHGDRRLMVFGTTTNSGLKVQFTGQQPTSFNFGYKRKEFSVLPLLRDEPTEEDPDSYGSVIAGISMRVRSAALPETGINASQFIATGDAADSLARQPSIHRLFASEATQSLARAAVEGIPRVDLDLVARAAPLCRRSLEIAQDPDLADRLRQIEAELGFTVGDFCVNPTADQLERLSAKMQERGLL